MAKKLVKIFVLILLGASPLIGSSCDQPFFKNDLEAIQARGVLRVITSNNATCYYEGSHGPVGFEYELAQAFAQYLGVELKPLVVDNYNDMVYKLLHGEADLIAAGFIPTTNIKRCLAFGPRYHEVKQQVVGRRGGPSPKEIIDLIGQPIWVKANTSHENRLVELKKKYPELSWMKISGYDTEELLEMVSQGIIPLTIADSDIVGTNRRYYPQLVIHFAITTGQKMAWAMDPQNHHLQKSVCQWFKLPTTTSLLKQLTEHYFGHLDNFDYVDLMKYHRRVRYHLPRYRKYFEDAAQKNGLDWKLVAAQAYQESHWNPRAKSFSGVRGLMMLTQETARDLGVKNRLDAKQSIFAGVRYLASLHRRLGEEVSEPDRTFMALAAYNVGYGHLTDARTLARQLEKNPNTWQSIRSTLPLLRYKKYYCALPHGYARGAEPIQYVDRIRTYYRILVLNMQKSEENHDTTTVSNDDAQFTIDKTIPL